MAEILTAGTPFEVTVDDGVTLRGETFGPSDGAPIVLSHCFTGTRQVWAPVAHRLAASRRVVVYDQRDHGSSDRSPHAASIWRLGRDLIEVIDALDVDRPVVAGHSMGGMAALAATLLVAEDDRPPFAGLGLVATSAGVAAWPGAKRVVDRLALRVADPRTDARMVGRRGTLLTRASFGADADPVDVEATRASFVATAPEARRAWLQAIRAFDVRDSLGRIEVPTVVLAGYRDLLLPPPHARAMGQGIPGARLRMLRGAGHMLPFERSGLVADELDALAPASPAA